MRVGYILADLDDSGAPWEYISTLVSKIADRNDITPVGLYTRGDTTQFDIDLIQVEGVVPNWHKNVRGDDIDLVHLNGLPLFANWAVWRCPVPVVATVHGTLHWATELPSKLQPSKKFARKMRFFDKVDKHTVDRAFAVSESTKQVLIEQAGWSSEDISVLYEGIDDSYFTRDVNPDSKWADRSYLLHVSSAAPKKNVQRLVKAYARYRDCVESPADLVIAGDGWPEQLNSMICTLGVEGSVHCVGFVDEDELIDLYDYAELFVFPSLHETFGLPNIEAMARETPVLTTKKYGIPDVVGSAAAFIDDPTSIDNIARAIEKTVTDTRLLSELGKRGACHSKHYTWKNHVDMILGEYDAIL
jgi:glycosyltransferase involved in cell wall biosynthesis